MIYISLSLSLYIHTYTLIITKLYFYEIRKNAFPIGLTHYTYYSGGGVGCLSPSDFVCLPTDKDMIK